MVIAFLIEKGLGFFEAKNLYDDEAIELLESFLALEKMRE